MIIEANKFGQLEESDLADFEFVNGVFLPDDYKSFLRQYNGGRPIKDQVTLVNSDVQWFYGMFDEPTWGSLFNALTVFYNRIPSWYMPVACDSGGNLYIMSLFEENYGLIAFWEHENEDTVSGHQYFDNMTFVSNSFSDFINALN